MPRIITPTRAPGVTPTTLAARDALVRHLAEHGALWPVLPWNPCALCALPRRFPSDEPLCRGCRRARARYGAALADLHPAALTARDWPLGTALRVFKDDHHTDVASQYARAFGALLSAFLQHALPPADTALVTAVPSSSPVVLSALARARVEGWPAPDVQTIAAARAGHLRQRHRPYPARIGIEGKWLIDASAVTGRAVIVLDDVATTGATLHSFAAALTDAGATSVRAVVLARMAGPDAHWLLGLLRDRYAVGVRWRPDTPKPGVPA